MRRVKERERDFDAGVGFVDLFVKMDFDDAIIVDADAFANRVLRDFEAAIEVATQGRCKKESDRKSEWAELESVSEGVCERRLD